MISAKLGHFFDKPLAPIARKISLTPNMLTMLGFFITSVAAVTLPFNLMAGGFLILLGGIFDMFDGIVARTNGKTSSFGAFLDSTLDRYSDSLIFCAVAVYFFQENNLSGVVFTIGTLVGALLISYVRARAEGLGIQCHVGLAERPERIVLLVVGCLTGWLFHLIMLLFFLSHITVIQRIYHVYRKTMPV